MKITEDMSLDVCLAIPLSKGMYAIVDMDCPSEILARKWSYANAGYAVCNWNGRNTATLLHRKVIGAKKGETVDHINRDKLDDRRRNLRIASRSLNSLNRNSENVYYCSWCPTKPWRVIVNRKSFGYYKERCDAVKVARTEKVKALNEAK